MAKKPIPAVPAAQAAIDKAIAETAAAKPAPENPRPAMPPELHRDFQIVAGAAGMAALPDQQHQTWKDALNRIASHVLSNLKKG